MPHSEISAHSRSVTYAVAEPKASQPVDLLEELHHLLEEYAPTWYTEEHRERVQSALRLGKRS